MLMSKLPCRLCAACGSRVRCGRPAQNCQLWRGLDEHEWVALDDGDDLCAVADQGGHVLEDVAGQRAAGAAGDGDREGLVALVVGAGAADRPAVAGVECLPAGAGGPGLGGGGEVDGADGEGVAGAAAAQGAAGGSVEDEAEAGGGGGMGGGGGGGGGRLGGGQAGEGGVVGVHRNRLRPWPSNGTRW